MGFETLKTIIENNKSVVDISFFPENALELNELAKQHNVKETLNQLLHVPFRFESNGSQIIFFDQHQEYKEEELARSEHSHSPFVELKNLK